MSNHDYICVAGDIHFPFADWDLLREFAKHVKFLRTKKKKLKVVQLGDITDQKAWSRFTGASDDMSPDAEWEGAYHDMHRFHDLVPNMEIIFGNHDIRQIKAATEAKIPRQLIKSLDEVFPFAGWNWHTANKPLIIDGIMFVHGDEGAGSAIIKAKNTGMSVVQGHDHQMYLEYIKSCGVTRFGLGGGCMIDQTARAFSYAAKNPMGCDTGYSIIAKGIPHIYPKL